VSVTVYTRKLLECSLTPRRKFLEGRIERQAGGVHLLVDFATLHDTSELLEVYVVISLPGILHGGHVECAGETAVQGWWDVVDTYLLARIKVGARKNE
jgi:hypothetical protein